MKKRQKRAMRTLFGWICTVSGILVMLAQLSVIFRLEKMHAAHLLPLVICAGFIWLGLRLFRLNDLELMTDASRQNDPKKAAKIIRQLERSPTQSIFMSSSITPKETMCSAQRSTDMLMYQVRRPRRISSLPATTAFPDASLHLNT